MSAWWLIRAFLAAVAFGRAYDLASHKRRGIAGGKSFLNHFIYFCAFYRLFGVHGQNISISQGLILAAHGVASVNPKAPSK
jgi:hypothetical protein